ncbi:MAG: tRNA pseudouridine(38-40) synthase TruA [Planctomycetes bacterium]|nr:tRNA pseudouridine(38-40) synthase TruA [Planctomycetota bacterium]
MPENRPLKNTVLVLSYDGTAYHGWQSQKNALSVQDLLQNCLRQLLDAPILRGLYGCGRTDAGVHAHGQVAAVRTRCSIPASGFAFALNTRLPPDVCVRAAAEVAPDFNPRYGAKMKLYRYTLHNSPIRPALGRRYCWHVKFPLDLDAMRAAAAHHAGRHDYTSFSNQERNQEGLDNVREVTRLDIARDGERVTLDFEGMSCLSHLVRNLTGTLVDVGCGRLSPEAMPGILAARDRAAAGQGAPAKGLCLEWIRYEGDAEGAQGAAQRT